ncbi:MAG TPA: hypothetical protein ENJ73_00085, partial [Desulfobacterales bacterium]|nr:hypothetical protein [Desulfobacterales bacterium]
MAATSTASCPIMCVSGCGRSSWSARGRQAAVEGERRVMGCSRREFLKSSVAAAAVLPLANLHQDEPVGLRLARAAPSAALPTLCGMCPWRCPLEVRLEDGRLAAVNGNPRFAPTGGRCCAKAKAAGRLLKDGARLRHPLKRVGKRGQGRWQRIGWGEAIDTVAAALEGAAGSDLLLYAGGASSRYIVELWRRLGGRVAANTRFCRHDAWEWRGSLLSVPASPRPDCLVVLGGHLGENISIAPLRTVLDWQAAGTTLVVVDPRCSTLAARADLHLMARPGTDEALLLAWLGFVFADLPEADPSEAAVRRLAASFDPGRAARLAGVEEGLIRKVGELLRRGRGMVRCGAGRRWYGEDQARLAAILLLDRLSSGAAPGGALPETALAPREAPSITAAAGANGRLARIIGCWGHNPLQALPDPFATMRALDRAELVFACDILPSESVLYADIVFPEAMFLERTDTFSLFPGQDGVVAGMPFPVIEAEGEVRDPYWISQQLAVRLGQTQGFEHTSIMARIAADLAPYGVTPAGLWEGGGLLPVTRPGTAADAETPPGEAAAPDAALPRAA